MLTPAGELMTSGEESPELALTAFLDSLAEAVASEG